MPFEYYENRKQTFSVGYQIDIFASIFIRGNRESFSFLYEDSKVFSSCWYFELDKKAVNL